jgi:heme O synthase-like polyprenyltransferase
MMPGVKGAEYTLSQMKFYAVLLVLLSVAAPSALGGIDRHDSLYYVFGGTAIIISLWYTSTVFRIDVDEPRTAGNRIPSAARSFFGSMLYLALMFVVVVTASAGITGGLLGALLAAAAIGRNEMRARSASDDSAA